MAQEKNLNSELNERIENELAENINAQSAELEALNKKVNSWNMSLNSRQRLVEQNDTQTDNLKRRETSVKNLIGYEWKEASDGAKIEVVNPATSELIDTVPNVTEEDVDEAVKVAMAEQKKWAEVPIHERADKLYKFVDLIEENKERLAQLLTAETGKPIKEARGELANVRIGVRAFIERAKHLYGESIPAGQEAGQEKTMQITKRDPI